MAEDYLVHHGILGQKWGIRRYQNPDGTLTEAGKARYRKIDGTLSTEGSKKIKEDIKKSQKIEDYDKRMKALDKAVKPFMNEEAIKNLKPLADAVAKADDDWNKAYDECRKSKEFKQLENELADNFYDVTGGKENWEMSLTEFRKGATDPKSYYYIWDEDEPFYYMQTDPRFKKTYEYYEKRKAADKKLRDECYDLAINTLNGMSDTTDKYDIAKHVSYAYEREINKRYKTNRNFRYNL